MNSQSKRIAGAAGVTPGLPERTARATFMAVLGLVSKRASIPLSSGVHIRGCHR